RDISSERRSAYKLGVAGGASVSSGAGGPASSSRRSLTDRPTDPGPNFGRRSPGIDRAQKSPAAVQLEERLGLPGIDLQPGLHGLGSIVGPMDELLAVAVAVAAGSGGLGGQVVGRLADGTHATVDQPGDQYVRGEVERDDHVDRGDVLQRQGLGRVPREP